METNTKELGISREAFEEAIERIGRMLAEAENEHSVAVLREDEIGKSIFRTVKFTVEIVLNILARVIPTESDTESGDI